jgi:hypothetical protein
MNFGSLKFIREFTKYTVILDSWLSQSRLRGEPSKVFQRS